MAGISRVGRDSAGGTITGPGVSSVKVNGATISVKGDSVTPHCPCADPPTPHQLSPVMVGSSSTVFAGGKPVCRSGDSASCGHSASGSGNVSAG